MINSTLHQCLDQLYPFYMEYGTVPITSELPEFWTDPISYGLFNKSNNQITSTGALIFDNHRHPTAEFKSAVRYAALLPLVLQELTLRYCLGLADPSVAHMKKYLSTHYKDQYTDQQARKLIVICIDNFRFAYGLGVKLIEVKGKLV